MKIKYYHVKDVKLYSFLHINMQMKNYENDMFISSVDEIDF